MSAVSKLLIVAALIVLAPTTSKALVGTVDDGDEFPFVVRLESKYPNGATSWCSGVVHGHILSTAGHCLYNAEKGGTAVGVTVPYTDTLGNRQKAYSKKIYIPKSYIADDAEYHNDYRGAPHDIAYVTLDRDVLINGYIHWGLELLGSIPAGKTECAEPECMDWSLNPERKAAFLETLQREVGDLSKATVRVIGYGSYKCADYKKREQDCIADGKRRYTEVPLKSNAASFSAPWLWCTGVDDSGTSPVQHGDSGGPVFIKALDGRWLYVGYTSRGDSEDSCASSMFNDLNLWRDAASDSLGMESSSFKQPSDAAIESWHEGISRQLFNEWLENESRNSNNWDPNVLLRLYTGQVNGPHPQFIDQILANSTYNYFGRDLPYSAILDDKRKYIDRWPQRTFAVSDISINCSENQRYGVSKCKVTASLEWTVRNGDRHREGISSVTLDLSMPLFNTTSLLLLQFTPTISGENGRVVSRENGGAITPSPPTSSVAHWIHNGSIVRLTASGTKREFYYISPRQGLLDVGVQQGALLFSGNRSGNSYTGTAYIFTKRCGPVAYAVAGEVGTDDRSVTMRGRAPRVDTNCHVVSTKDDTLTFVFAED
jgi:hypothetical protein